MCGALRNYPDQWAQSVHTLEFVHQRSGGGRGKGFQKAIRHPVPAEVRAAIVQRLRLLLMRLTGNEWALKPAQVTVPPPSVSLRPQAAALTLSEIAVKPKSVRMEP